MKQKDEAAVSPALEPAAATAEVADEGGTPGDVEIGSENIGTGSEADETWRPTNEQTRPIVRDERDGRRTP